MRNRCNYGSSGTIAVPKSLTALLPSSNFSSICCPGPCQPRKTRMFAFWETVSSWDIMIWSVVLFNRIICVTFFLSSFSISICLSCCILSLLTISSCTCASTRRRLRACGVPPCCYCRRRSTTASTFTSALMCCTSCCTTAGSLFSSRSFSFLSSSLPLFFVFFFNKNFSSSLFLSYFLSLFLLALTRRYNPDGAEDSPTREDLTRVFGQLSLQCDDKASFALLFQYGMASQWLRALGTRLYNVVVSLRACAWALLFSGTFFWCCYC